MALDSVNRAPQPRDPNSLSVHLNESYDFLQQLSKRLISLSERVAGSAPREVDDSPKAGTSLLDKSGQIRRVLADIEHEILRLEQSL